MSHFSQATSRILSKGRAGLPGRRLFRQFHRFHITKIRSSESLSLVKTNSIMSMKEMLLLRASWFHMGVRRQRGSSSGHPYNACTVSSLCYLQASHKSSYSILRLTKFALVGMESLQAHHTKCFTLFGIPRYQIFLHNSFMGSKLDEPCCCINCASYKSLYSDFTEYSPSGLKGQISTSS